MKQKLLLRTFLLFFFLSLIGLNAQQNPVSPFDGTTNTYSNNSNSKSVVSHMQKIQSISDLFVSGGNRLVEMQNPDGNWGWPLEGNYPLNTIGPIGMGLAQAYRQTGDQSFLEALLKTGNVLLTKTAFSPSDGYLAAELDNLFGVSTYTDYVKTNYYDKLANGTYDRNGTLYTTVQYVDKIRSDRESQDIANLAVWDIGMGLVGAAMCGASTQEWIDGVKAEINELDGNAYYDVIGLAGAIYGLAYVGEDFDPTSGEHAAASNLSDLANILASYQIDGGGFAWNSQYVIPDDNNEAIQETAYSILALNEVNRDLYLDAIQGAANYLASVQLVTGGWENYVGYGENNEVTGEALWALNSLSFSGFNENTGKYYASLQDAIDDASDGDIISVGSGIHNAIEITNDGITLVGEDGSVINSGSPAITVNASNVTITGFTFNFGNDNWAILFNAGSNNNVVYNCKFLVNYGINNAAGNTDVNAEKNYWGSATGPTHSSNSIGTGAVISDRVDYFPYWSDDTFTHWNGIFTPVNGQTGVPIEPTFTWQEYEGATKYKLLVSYTNTFGADNFYAVEQGTNLSKVMSELEDNFPLDNSTKYFWKVAAFVNGSYIHSEIHEFTTVPKVTVTQGNPVGGTVYTTSTMFTWSIGQAVGNMKFKVQIVAKVGAIEPTELEWASATLTATTSSLYRTFTLNSGTHYFWRVVVLNSNDEEISYSSVIDFTTSGGTTVTVTPSWPVGEAEVYTNTPTLYWYLDQYAHGVKYEIDYVASTTGDVDVDGKLIGSTTTALTGNLYFKLPTLNSGTQYYWQVRAEYNGTYGEYSDPVSFTTIGSGTLLEPTPSYPVGELEIYTVSPTLYWYLGGSSDGLTFNIEYRPQGNAALTETSSSLYKKITNLIPGTVYEWRVQSDNGTSQSTWSDWAVFKVSGGVTSSMPVASYPTGNPTIYSQNPTLSWYLDGSTLGIEGYIVKYSQTDLTGSWSTDLGAPDETDGQFSINNLYTTSWKVTADLTYGQKYYWAVAAVDGSSSLSAFSSTESFTIVGGAGTGDVILTNPIGGVTISTTSPTLRWYFTGSSIGIVGYDVEYSDNGGLSSWTHVSSALSSTKTYVELSNLSAGATYTWKVRAYYGGSTYSSWSDEETFIVDNGSAIVQPYVGGPNNVTIGSSSATLSWINPSQNNKKLTYEIEVSSSPDFSNSQLIESDKNFGEVTSLNSKSEYYWRVRAKSSKGEYSNYSSVAKFSTDNSVTGIVEDELPTEYEITQNYPNPFNPSTVINYSVPKASYVTIKIYNMLGQEVKTLVSKEVLQGHFSVTWNGDNSNGNKVSSGTYVYRMIAGDYMQTKKMILLK